MINFIKWLENKDSSALSPPQHKVGEVDKNLDDVVGKRLLQLAMEMETEGKGSRQDVLKSIERIIGTVSQKQNQQQTNSNAAMDPTNMGMQNAQQVGSSQQPAPVV
jgi:hypothetical protein